MLTGTLAALFVRSFQLTVVTSSTNNIYLALIEFAIDNYFNNLFINGFSSLLHKQIKSNLLVISGLELYLCGINFTVTLLFQYLLINSLSVV